MQTSLLGIAQKAKQNKKYKFGNLYELIDKYALLQAWRQINKGAASGVDRERAKEFKKNIETNLEEMLEELKTKKYKARLVKRVFIPKGKDGKRPLGLPVLRDKIIQRAAANIYLHYVLDLWFEKGIKPKCEAEAYY
ncbi:reverse transcriptase family protein [Acetivibrio cellulolyticus]|uniref:RNA-directed DNA polymerase n=1 Tax=Acetivibrio cellulolyticus TaxID=35830 RepID=UPI0001E2C735|nr:RNA-directed DNA polymerase [Acetivibrio cellulolyticus]